METKNQKIVAWTLIGFGVLLAFTNSVGISFGKFVFPTILVAFGWWLIVKSPSLTFLHNATINPVGEVNIDDTWDVKNKSILALAGDFNVDFRDVVLPTGETVIQYTSIACDVDIRVPKDFPIKFVANAIATESLVNGAKEEYIFSGYQYQTPAFDEAENRIIIKVNSIAVDIEITQY